MLKLKGTDCFIPTSPDELKYGAYLAFEAKNWPQFFEQCSGMVAAERTEIFLRSYAAHCSGLVIQSIELREPSQTVFIDGSVYHLPKDLLSESAKQFDMWTQQPDDLRKLAVYLVDVRFLNETTHAKMVATLLSAPAYCVLSLLAFFLTAQNPLNRLLASFQTCRQQQNTDVQVLAKLAVGVDGITFSSAWQASLTTSKPSTE